MSLLVIAADLHLQSGFRMADTVFALRQIVDIATAAEACGVILCGDILDSYRNTPQPVNALHSFLDDLDDADIPCGYIVGNHDGVSDESWAHGHRHAQHLHKRPASFAGVDVYGLDFQPAGRLQVELALVPKRTDLLCLHQAWATWMGAIASPQGDFGDIPVVSCVATGDLHQCRIEEHTGKDGQDLLVGSPGATCQQAKNEPVHHHVLFYEDGQFKKKSLKSRQILSIGPLVNDGDLAQLLDGQLERELAAALHQAVSDKLPDDMQRPWLRIQYSYALPDVVRRVEKLVNKRAVLFFDEIAPDREVSVGRAVVIEHSKGGAVTPLSLLPDYVDCAKSPATFELVSALLSSADQEGAWQRWRSEFLREKNDGESIEEV